MGSICKKEKNQQQQQKQSAQKEQEQDDATNQDWYSDDTDFTVSKQFQIGVINPSLIYDYQELEKNENEIEYFLKSLGSKRIFKTSQQLDDQILKTITQAPYTNQFVQMVHLAYYGHFPLSFSPDNIQLLTEQKIFLMIYLSCHFKKIKQQRQIFLCCINQVFSEHINLNAEQFRKKFVSHKGKKELEVQFKKGLNYTNGQFQS